MIRSASPLLIGILLSVVAGCDSDEHAPAAAEPQADLVQFGETDDEEPKPTHPEFDFSIDDFESVE